MFLPLGPFCKELERLFARSWEYFVPQPDTILTLCASRKKGP
jgi:hypothetical protein